MTKKHNTLSVTFHVTRDCNLRCHYCYTGDKVADKMSDEVIESAIAFIKSEVKSRDIDSLNIIFFGGEPLIELKKICMIHDLLVNSIEGVDFYFAMSTNGTLLTNATIHELSYRNIYTSISIDGTPEVQDKQRPMVNGKGTSSIIQEVIPRLLAWSPCSEARCVVTPQSGLVVDETVAWLYEKGFKYIAVAMDYSADWKRADILNLEGSLNRLSNWYGKLLLADKPIYLSCFDERIRTRTAGPLEESERCAIGVKQFSISPSGKIYPCVQFVKNDDDLTYVIGDIWAGLDKAKLHSVFSCAEHEKEECGDCTVKDRCSSWCACSNFSTTGKLNAASPVLCEFERVILPIADKLGNMLWQKGSKRFVGKFYNEAFPVLDYLENNIKRSK